MQDHQRAQLQYVQQQQQAQHAQVQHAQGQGQAQAQAQAAVQHQQAALAHAAAAQQAAQQAHAAAASQMIAASAPPPSLWPRVPIHMPSKDLRPDCSAQIALSLAAAKDRPEEIAHSLDGGGAGGKHPRSPMGRAFYLPPVSINADSSEVMGLSVNTIPATRAIARSHSSDFP